MENIRWELLEHPPYSPDLTPSNYLLVSKPMQVLGEKLGKE
jgi:hypothetical protein